MDKIKKLIIMLISKGESKPVFNYKPSVLYYVNLIVGRVVKTVFTRPPNIVIQHLITKLVESP